MRAVTYRLSPDGGEFAEGSALLSDAGVHREAIREIRTLADESVVMQFEVGGDVRRLRQRFDGDCEGLLDYDLIDVDENTLLQLHFRPDGPLRKLIDLHREHAVVIDYPIEFIDPPDPTVRMVEVGRIDDLRALIERVRDVATVTIEEVGTYEPVSNRLFCSLTDRQQQVLQTAIERGYYDVPRDVTYEDIARDLDCSASTVGQHLRRIEATVLRQITPTSAERELPGRPVQ